MKILMLIKNLEYGGAFKMFLWVADKLAQQGDDVTILTYLPNQEVVIPNNIKLIRINLKNTGFFARTKIIRKIIQEQSPDISLSFLLDANIYNILGCLGTNVKSVVCERNDPFKPHYYKLKLLKPLFSFADGAVFQLPKARDYYTNIKVPTAIIPNPVRENREKITKSFEERDKVVSTLGRIDIFQKRQDVLITAFSIFHNNHPDYKLEIWGDGSQQDEEKIKHQISFLNLDDCVIMKGVTNTPSKSIMNSKFFVLSSDFEGIPNALIEAMSLGLPCISTKCSPGGAELLISDRRNGLLVPCGDYRSLSDKMCWIVEHPIDSDNMGKEASKISEKFSDDIISKMWFDYLKSI